MNGWIGQEEELRSDVLKMILYELNTAISPKETRLSALKAVYEELNHSDANKHDQELDYHADKILFQKLALTYSLDPYSDEMGMILGLLELVYRASRGRVALSYSEIGDSLLPLLIEVIREQVKVNVNVGSEAGTDSVSGSGIGINDGEVKEVEEDVSVADSDTAVRSGVDPDVVEEHPHETLEDGEHDYSDIDKVGDLRKSVPTDDTSTSCTNSINSASDGMNMNGMNGMHGMNGMSTARQKSVRFSTQEEVSVIPDGSVIHPHHPPSKHPHQSSQHPHSQQHPHEHPQSDPLAVRKVLKILRYYSRVLPAMVPMAHQHGLLDALIYQLHTNLMKKKSNDAREALRRNLLRMSDEHQQEQQQQRLEQEEQFKQEQLSNLGIDDASTASASASISSRSTNRSIPLLSLLQAQEEAIAGTSFDKDKDSLTRVDIIATIVNLACAEENKNKLLYHPGLLEAVLAVAKDDPVKEAREHAAIAIMNLALADPNKQFLANRDDLLEALIKLFDDNFSFTRRYASATIFTLSCLPINTKRLIEFSNYQIITALSKLLGYDQDEEVRVNAAKTIFQLTRNDEPYMVEGMILNSDILSCLAQTVISDYSADVRAYSARALEWMAADIYAPSPCHHRLLTALAKASAWTKTSCIAEAFKSQSTFSVNRRTMAEHELVLDALAMLASLDGVNDSEAQECALMAIENLTMEETTRGIMAGHEGVMTALTRATFKKSEYEEYENDPSATKTALKNLASHITFDE